MQPCGGGVLPYVWNRPPCRHLANGVDLAPYINYSQVSQPDVTKRTPVILYLGRFHPLRGIEHLIDAFRFVSREFPDARLVIAGPDEGHLQASYRRRAQSHGLRDGQVIFPGILRVEEKLNWLRRADLFCMPSVAEGFSIAVLEAMASSVAVVLSAGCHFPEAANSGAARICSTEPPELAKVLVELLANPDTTAEMGRRGHDLVRERYSLDRVIDELVGLYEEGIARSRDSRHDPEKT